MAPNLKTFLARGVEQVRRHGVRLLWLRYVRRRAILGTPPAVCDAESAIEVHTQVCGRDWLNALWSLKSFAFVVQQPMRVVLLADASVPPPAVATLRKHFPGTEVRQCETLPEETRGAFAEQFPTLWALRNDPRFFTLPKVLDSFALRRNPVVLTIDPDVLFFARPEELLADLDPLRPYFARLNVTATDSDLPSTFCLDPVALDSQFGLKLPPRFNTGLGSLDYSRVDWPLVERIVKSVPLDPARGFMADQTLLGIMCAAHGFETLAVGQYAIKPVANLEGVVARHYYAKTRDLLYLEGIPALVRAGLLAAPSRRSS